MGQPGEKIDLSTFIAYLLPGFIVQLIIFSLLDSVYYIVNRASLVSAILSMAVPHLLAVGAALIVLGYFLGLLIDLYSHTFTVQYETDRKNEAYQEVISDLQEIIKKTSHSELLKGDTQDAIKKRNTYIDTMFYHYATPSQWLRQNWSWSFYEAARDLVILFLPTVFFLSFYATIIIAIILCEDGLAAIAISSIAATIMTLIVKKYFYQRLKDYRDTICRVYHRHRAYVVLGTIIGAILTPVEKPEKSR